MYFFGLERCTVSLTEYNVTRLQHLVLSAPLFQHLNLLAVSSKNSKAFIHSGASNQFSLDDIKAILAKIVSAADYKRYEDSVTTLIKAGHIELDFQMMKRAASLLARCFDGVPLTLGQANSILLIVAQEFSEKEVHRAKRVQQCVVTNALAKFFNQEEFFKYLADTQAQRDQGLVLFDDLIGYRGAPSAVTIDLTTGLHRFWSIKPIVKPTQDG